MTKHRSVTPRKRKAIAMTKEQLDALVALHQQQQRERMLGIQSTGRPTELTPTLQAMICAQVQNHALPERAAMACGVTRATFYAWKQKGAAGIQPYANFLDALEEADSIAQVKMVNVHQELVKGTWQGQADWMSRRWPRDFAGGNRPALPDPDEARRADKIDVSKLTNEQLDALAAQIEEVLANIGAVTIDGQATRVPE